MQKIVLGSLLLAALGAIAAGGLPAGQVYWQETQPATRAAPDGGCACPPATGALTAGNLGMCLAQNLSLHAVMQCSNAGDGGAFTAGSMVSYYCSPNLQTWMPAQTSNNFTIPTTGGTAIGPELTVGSPFGRFMYGSAGAACSGGAGAYWDGGVLVTVEGAQR